MLSIVGDKSYGLLSIVPKTKDGNPIIDFESHIIYRDGKELKEWIALAEYMRSFSPQNGVPNVPTYYSQTQGRKTVNPDSNIIARFKNPNNISKVIYGIILLVLIIIIVIVKLIFRRRKRRRRYMFSRY